MHPAQYPQLPGLCITECLTHNATGLLVPYATCGQVLLQGMPAGGMASGTLRGLRDVVQEEGEQRGS